MFFKLSSYLKKPELYSRTRELFWNDPHVSSQMLLAHLDPSIDATSRKHAFIQKSASWIASLLPEEAALLNLGCGPGLYAKLFASKGLRVTGIDISPRSISYAKEQDNVSEYILGDYTKLAYKNCFDIVTLIYCDYGALTLSERKALLLGISRALKPGGMFLLDAFTSLACTGPIDCTSGEVLAQGGFWSKEPHVCMNAKYFYKNKIELRRYVVIENSAVRCYNIWETYFFEQDLIKEAEPFGFLKHGTYDDAAGTPHTAQPKTLCAIFKKEL